MLTCVCRWVLPFSEVLDWTATAIIADERTLLQTLEVIRSVDKRKIFRMKQQTQILWNQYLSSVERIVETVFEVLLITMHLIKFARKR